MASNLTTPKTIHEGVIRLCAKIGATQAPVFIPAAKPESGFLPLYCFENSQAKVETSGGSVVLGWTLWEFPRVMIEGEFHAVWRSPDGVLVDVTPRPDGEERILFVPDVSRRYEGLRVDNIRMALSPDPAILELIAANEEMFRVRTRGSRAFTRIEPPDSEIEPIMRRIWDASGRIKKRLKLR
ncbi:MAG TPA: hypothetical protein VHE13_16680 [Opitutus sp.]|nr:hypothetical protein [Opitutus sp.]